MKSSVLVTCRDLIFTTKITSTAKELGVRYKPCPFLSQAVQAAAEGPELVLVDLSGLAMSDMPALAELRAALPASSRVVAFGSHVDVALLNAARQAGCDEVMPRSEFTVRLVEMLRPFGESR